MVRYRMVLSPGTSMCIFHGVHIDVGIVALVDYRSVHDRFLCSFIFWPVLLINMALYGFESCFFLPINWANSLLLVQNLVPGGSHLKYKWDVWIPFASLDPT
jgi:hypothetical protein